MFAILHALGMFVADMFKSRCRLEAENLFLLCVPKTSSGNDFGFGRKNSLFLRKNGLHPLR